MMYEISKEQIELVINLIVKSSGAKYGEAYNTIMVLQNLKEKGEPDVDKQSSSS